jgi:hypothetical protein
LCGLAVFGLVFACNETRHEKKEVFVNPYEEGGIRHNKGLDTVLKDLWAARIEAFLATTRAGGESCGKPLSREEMVEIAYKSVARAMGGWFQGFDMNAMSSLVSSEKFTRLATSPATRSSDVVEAFDEIRYTPFQQKYLDKLANIVEAADDLYDMLGKITALEKEVARKAPSEEEAAPVLAAAAVGRHSAEYWYANDRLWRAMRESTILSVQQIELSQTRSSDGWDSPIFLPHPEDFSKYYMIENGWVFELECPAGLWFNEELCSCDWPQNVSRSERNEIIMIDLMAAGLGLSAGGPFGMVAMGILFSTAAYL